MENGLGSETEVGSWRWKSVPALILPLIRGPSHSASTSSGKKAPTVILQLPCSQMFWSWGPFTLLKITANLQELWFI